MTSDTLLQEAKAATHEIITLVKEQFVPLSSEILNQKPSPQQWSIAECLEHLNYYGNYYNKEVQIAIAKAKAKQWDAVPNFSSTWLGKKSIESVLPDNAKPSKTPKALNPSMSTVKPDVIQRFLVGQNEFLNLLQSAQTIDLNRTKVRIEVFKLLKLRLGDLFLFMIAHNQRHCNQALRVGHFDEALIFTKS